MGDPFRIMPIRAIGYSFGIGEAMKYVFKWRDVDVVQTIGSFFAVAHIVHSGLVDKALPALAGTILFEGICTCIIPPLVNYHVCRLVARVLWDLQGIPNIVKRWGPFVAGLVTLPFLYAYVDPAIDEFIQAQVVPLF